MYHRKTGIVQVLCVFIHVAENALSLSLSLQSLAQSDFAIKVFFFFLLIVVYKE